MHCYWRCARIFAVYIELSLDLGHTPLINIQYIQKELMIEIPFGCAIITPMRKLLSEHPAHLKRQAIRKKHGMSKHDKRNIGIFKPSARTSKN